MADVSERIQRMEKDLRDATTRYDSCAAELQVIITVLYSASETLNRELLYEFSNTVNKAKNLYSSKNDNHYLHF